MKLYISSLIIGALGAWSMSKIGPMIGLVDYPADRSSHKFSTPKGGGIGILLTFLLASIIAKVNLFFVVPILILSLFALFNDKYEIDPKIRLATQFLAVFVLTVGMIKINTAGSMIIIVLYSIFIVGTANIYNFMDGINGIAAVTGIIGFSFLAFFSIHGSYGQWISMITICIVFACLGFLPFNLPTARVFMGDVGSILLGLLFAAITVIMARDLTDFICFSGFLFTFYIDELSTMFIRIKRRENLLYPHREHLYQLLANEMGMSHFNITVLYGIIQFIVGVSIVFIKPFGIKAVSLIILLYAALFIMISSRIRHKAGIIRASR